MKNILFLFLFFLVGWQSHAYVPISQTWSSQFKDATEVQNLAPDLLNMQLETFLDLTPKKYRQKTGKRLGLKKTLQLRTAQKFVKRKLKIEPQISGGLFCLMGVFWLGWLAMGIMDDWGGINWVTNILLSILWLPGLLHTLIKKKDYF